MISTRRLLEMARRWKKTAVTGRRKISMGGVQSSTSQVDNCSRMPASKSNAFVVYSTEEKRFVISLKNLSSPIMQELFKMSEDEFGLANNRPIMFPCDGVLLEYFLSMIQRRMDEEVEKALLFFMSTQHSSFLSLLLEEANLQIPICSY